MKKYNFDLILTSEQLKANRLRHLQQDEEKKDMKITLIIATVSILISLLLLNC